MKIPTTYEATPARFMAVSTLALGLWAMPAEPANAAAQPETTPEGIVYEIGGIGLDEVAQIKADRPRFSLALLTAAQGSGAYLADVHVVIRNAKGHPVLDLVMEAPWLLIDLPPGRYEIVAEREQQGQRIAISLAPNQRRDAVLYFRVPGLERRELDDSGPPR